jgi:hypothetical protein
MSERGWRNGLCENAQINVDPWKWCDRPAVWTDRRGGRTCDECYQESRAFVARALVVSVDELEETRVRDEAP